MNQLLTVGGLLFVFLLPVSVTAAETPVSLETDVLPLLKKRCAACHGPLKSEAKLILSSPRHIARGSEDGPVVIAGNLEESRLWMAVRDDEMPEDEPLSAKEKRLLRDWISSGAAGLPEYVEGDDAPIEHWAFARLSQPEPPTLPESARQQKRLSEIDRFIAAKLAAKRLHLSPEADRETLIRRVAFDLTGLPPTLQQRQDYLADSKSDAYARMVERYLESSHYGERWGKFWLDVAGYADSDGYFIDFDQVRPLAYFYRDYVIRAFNTNKPFDQFVREQLAGDELSGHRPGRELTPEQVDMLIATHFLRNSEDGTDRNMGTPQERITTRYATLEGTMQIVASSLMGLTVKCAQCHDHKFEPITQRQYYEFQSILYPAFEIENWVTPKNRWVDTASKAVIQAWEDSVTNAERRLAEQKQAFAAWEKQARPVGERLWQTDFSGTTDSLQEDWSVHPPTADAPQVDFGEQSDIAVFVEDGVLKMKDAKPSRLTWITTQEQFDWTPEQPGEWVQLSFDLVDGSRATRGRMARFGFLIATSPADDAQQGGNVLIDSSPAYGIDVITNSLSKGGMRGQTGARFRGYFPGTNYGVRLTNIGDGKFELEHVLNGLPEEKDPAQPRVVRSLIVTAKELPDGGFGFAYRGEGLHFSVDNIRVERSSPELATAALQSSRMRLNAARDAELTKIETIETEIETIRGDRPGKVAWVTDRSDKATDVFLLNRGSYFSKGDKVSPKEFAFLADKSNRLALDTAAKEQSGQTTGRRLAFARWITQPDSRASALLARVTVNRMWQRHFGTGIVASTELLTSCGEPSRMTSESQQSNRRLFLGQSLGGLGGLALSQLLNEQTARGFDAAAPQKPRAKAVISLFQHGGPSHVDMFDPKPMLTKMHGKTWSGNLSFRSPTTSKRILGSPFEFSKHGKSGIELSELLPHTAEIVDDMTLIRSMKTKASDHTAAIRLINTGQFLPGSPVLGSWIIYGLGAETDSLPAYVVLVQGSYPTDGVGNWSSGWLPAEYQGTPFRSGSSPVQYLKTPGRFTAQARSGQLNFLSRLNRFHQTRHPKNDELLARIKDFETAARMQVAVPEVLDFSDEPKEIQKMYGLESPNPRTRDYARRCLLSRRLVERGVRFVQVCMASQPWDTHNKNVSRLKDLCATTDQPSAALVKDLKQRGLLDETVVMWGGEFGREPISEGADGRDHNPQGFSLWLAGGGFKAGYAHGETDEIGYQAVSSVVTVHSLHATLLHALGIDHRRLAAPHDGRDVSLVDSPVTGADIVPDLLG